MLDFVWSWNHCFIWQYPSFMPVQTETVSQKITPSSNVYILFIKGLDFFCSSVDASRPVLMLFWQCLVFVWLEIFQVIKKLHTNCCLKIYCVYLFCIFWLWRRLFQFSIPLFWISHVKTGAQALLKSAKPESVLKWCLLILYCLLFFTGNNMGRLCQKYSYCNYYFYYSRICTGTYYF